MQCSLTGQIFNGKYAAEIGLVNFAMTLARLGEVQGLTNSWESFNSTWNEELQSGAVRIILQAVPQRHPEHLNVARVVEFAKGVIDE